LTDGNLQSSSDASISYLLEDSNREHHEELEDDKQQFNLSPQ
jgi:hypothetical protein